MIVDLISPWLAAIEATDSATSQRAFRARHATILNGLRVARTPSFEQFPLVTDTTRLRLLARRAADPATQQLLRDALARAATLGADQCRHLALVAGDGTDDGVEPIVSGHADLVLLVQADIVDDGMILDLGRGVTAHTRWSAVDSVSPLTGRWGEGWNRRDAAQGVALREWIYTEGIGLHLAHALVPALSPHQLLRLNLATFNRLREREKTFAPMLDIDLDQSGFALVLRWLSPGATAASRTVGDVVIPPAAGRYLAWRMTSERVARLGMRGAIRAEA